MKILFFMACLLGLTLQACEQIEKTGKEDIAANGRYAVNFGISEGVETKLTGNSDESAVNSVLFIVFDENGDYVTSARPSGTSAEVELYEGSYNVAAIVNADGLEINGSNSLGTVRDITVRLEDNSKGDLVMYGEKQFTIGSNGSNVTVDVKRVVAKIALGNVINEMKDPVFQAMEFEIRRIFISNVSGLSDITGSDSPTLWYNMNGTWNDESDEVKALIEDDGIDTVIPYKGNYQQEHYYYAYPNDTETDSFDSIWSPRFTRLVIEASLGGDICYYPIPFGNIEANHTYTINNLTITKPGTQYPWEEIDGEACTFTVNVSDWEEGLNMDKTI